MRKVLLITGIILAVLCVIAFAAAVFFRYSFLNIMDGSQALYNRLHQRMLIALITGIVLAIITVACFVVRRFIN